VKAGERMKSLGETQRRAAERVGHGLDDIRTTSLLLTPLANESHRPSGDHAKLKILFQERPEARGREVG